MTQLDLNNIREVAGNWVKLNTQQRNRLLSKYNEETQRKIVISALALTMAQFKPELSKLRM